MTTTSRRTSILAVTAACLATLLGIPPHPASASCAVPPPLEEALAQAPIAFVGTAIEVREGTLARFRVEEVWAGPDLEEAVVHGGPGGLGTQTSVDRTWDPGRRYLVLPHTDGGELHDNSCSQTQVWTEELAALRPADARTVTPSATPEVTDTGWDETVVTMGALAVLLAAGAAFAARRRR